MSAKPVIRYATQDDAEQILALICEHAQFEKEPFDPRGRLESLRAVMAAKDPPFRCLVVETEQGIQGYCNFMPQVDSWSCESYMFVDALYLRETMRGASIGKELMAKVASEARLLGCTSVRVMTPAENSGGAAFYRKLGGLSMDKIWFSIPIPIPMDS